jgi:hypothetical protein
VIAVLTGLVAGLVHVASGPDHLAAVAPLALRTQRRSWLTGVHWAGGHASGVLVLGCLSLWLRSALPLDLISSWSERLVGVVLIGVGLWTLRQALSGNLHTHAHWHGGQQHVHAHAHNSLRTHPDPRLHPHGHAAFAIGAVHGLAGSAHLLGILPALALPSHAAALAYLAAYGFGTILAMTIFSSLLGWVALRCATGLTLYRALLLFFATTATVIGGFWLAA